MQVTSSATVVVVLLMAFGATTAGLPGPHTMPLQNATAVEPSAQKLPRRQTLVRVTVERFAALMTSAEWTRVDRFYRLREDAPVWTTEHGRRAALALIDRVAASVDDGVPGARDTATRLYTQLSFATDDAEALAALDVRLTNAFIEWGRQLALGVTDADASSRDIDVVGTLAAIHDAQHVHRAIEALEPRHTAYRQLREALRAYRSIAARGGWTEMPSILLRASATSALVPDQVQDAVAVLCDRLLLTGDLKFMPESCGAGETASTYNEELAAAVRRFQRRHGLRIDGVVGPKTIAALNVPVEDRIRALASNMDAWRKMPDDLGRSYVKVNVPAFRLKAVHNGNEALSMRVVVGKPATPTPTMADEISYIEFRPYWNVPYSITHGELLPRIAEDPDYLRRHRFEVVDGWETPAKVIDPATIESWMSEDFPYRLRQRPGPRNSLGLVKFMFPNRYNVYLHDTPARHLFQPRRRAFSHGCVRVEDPAALADFLLRDDAMWSRATIEFAMQAGRRRVVQLDTTVPVYLTYFTAWIESENETVNFRADLYGRFRSTD